MNNDTISLSMEIKNKIITPENLIELIDIIFEDYEKSYKLFTEKKMENEPEFIITLFKPDGESNQTKNYQKIKNEKKLFTNKYEGIKLEYNSNLEDNNIEINIISKYSFRFHGYFPYMNNEITISGTNEEWVRSRYDKINRLISSWKDQMSLFSKYENYTTLSFIGIWFIILFGAFYLIFNFFSTYTINLTSVLSLVFAIILGVYTQQQFSNLFPRIELLTGPDHLHYEEEKRKRIIFIVITIVIPFIFVIIGLILTNVIKIR